MSHDPQYLTPQGLHGLLMGERIICAKAIPVGESWPGRYVATPGDTLIVFSSATNLAHPVVENRYGETFTLAAFSREQQEELRLFRDRRVRQ